MKKDLMDCEREILELYLNQDLFNHKQYFNYLVHQAIDEGSWEIDTNGRRNSKGIELIVRPECNQKCEYCYIARHGNTLYPHAERVDKETIVKNIDIILTYVFDTKQYYANHWELFAGDMFYDDIYFDILDVFYKHLVPYQKKYPQIFKYNEGLILTPTNFSFIDDDAKAARVEEYIRKFREDLNWEIGFSISTDGKYAVDTREQRPVDDAHFEKLFQWTLKYPRGGFHPILSASNIKNAIQNYDWWKAKYAEYYPEGISEGNFLPYWLEARNDEWTDESIKDFLNLITYMLNDRFKMCGNDVDELARHIFGAECSVHRPIHLDLQCIDQVGGDRVSHGTSGCSLSGLVCINTANFAIVPCHRLNYRQFRGGYFVVEDGAITGVEPFNVSGYLSLVTAPADSVPDCAFCKFNVVCHKGCAGAQFESSGEPFLTCQSVCNLIRAWFTHLLVLYDEMGVLESGRRQNLIPEHMTIVYDAILEESERLKVWMREMN